MVHVGDHGMIHVLYNTCISCHDPLGIYLSQVGVSGREKMIKARIIIEGAKHSRIEGGEVEKMNNFKFITNSP